MKYIELFEDLDPYYLEQYAKHIKQDCQPFFAKNPQMLPLYRGLNHSDNFIKKQRRIDRKPLGTNVFRHKLAVTAFNELGFTANRDNSYFCTGAMDQADEFGTIYYIFPIGEFSFTWSPDVKDFTYDVHVGTSPNYYFITFSNMQDTIVTDDQIEQIRDILHKLDIQVELVFNRQYMKQPCFLVHMNKNQDTRLSIELGNIGLNHFVSSSTSIKDTKAALIKKGFTNMDLTSAIQSGGEILINSQEYYGINARTLNTPNVSYETLKGLLS